MTSQPLITGRTGACDGAVAAGTRYRRSGTVPYSKDRFYLIGEKPLSRWFQSGRALPEAWDVAEELALR